MDGPKGARGEQAGTGRKPVSGAMKMELHPGYKSPSISDKLEHRWGECVSVIVIVMGN